MKKPLIEIQPGTAIDPDAVISVDQSSAPREHSHERAEVAIVRLHDGRSYHVVSPYTVVVDQINAARAEEA